jgi:hypothetical protein
VLEIGGPENLTFNELAKAVQTAAGRSRPLRHISPAMLRLMGGTIGRAKPELGRQASAALVMDSADLAFDAAPLRDSYKDLPITSLADVLDHRGT